jgi:thiosulfate/3-mercaptopyruvate sulfurtransferase
MIAGNEPFRKGKVKWVSTDWLRESLDDGPMILDAQPNVHDYIQEHIPGAVYMNEGLFRIPLQGLPAQYVPPDVVQSLFRRAGLLPNAPVVVYTGTGPFKGWGDGLEQTMMAYTLARHGHDNVYVLDGGIDKWKAESHPLSQAFPQVEPSTFVVQVRDDYFVDYEAFKAMKDGDGVRLLDARPPDVYAGQGPWRKAGHIPGAINLPWKSLMDEGNARLLKPTDELTSILEAHDVTPDKTVICSCGTGREATNEFILLKWYMGYPKVKIYEGSFTEWSAYDDNPTVVGESPR